VIHGAWRWSSTTCRSAILGQISDSEAVTRRARQVLDAARAARVRTVFMRHITMPRRLMGAAQLRMWKAWQRRDSAADVVSALPAGAAHVDITPSWSQAPTRRSSTRSRCRPSRARRWTSSYATAA
jgi:hypothetical protein